VAALTEVLRDSHESGSIREMWVFEALAAIANDEAISILLEKLEDPVELTRKRAGEALGQSGRPEAFDLLDGRLEVAYPDVREAVLEGALEALDDEIDRKLLSRDLDGLTPYLDIQQQIDATWVATASAALGLDEAEVKGRLEALVPMFGLRLEWLE